jgi:hypothetical protein
MTEEQRKNLQPGDIFRAPNGQAYKVTKVLRDHLTAHPLHCEDNVFVDFDSLKLVAKFEQRDGKPGWTLCDNVIPGFGPSHA